ncbi:RPP14 family protein [Megaselia abdita]
MSGYYYIDFTLKTKETKEPLPIYVKGSIEQSLRTIYGEIGGISTVDLIKFDRETGRGILRVPESNYVKTRTALTLISKFQEVPCHFQVHAASPVILGLLKTHVEF